MTPTMTVSVSAAEIPPTIMATMPTAMTVIMLATVTSPMPTTVTVPATVSMTTVLRERSSGTEGQDTHDGERREDEA